MKFSSRAILLSLAPLFLLFTTSGCTPGTGDYSGKVSTVGIRAETAGKIAYWLIPLTETFEADRKMLFDMTLEDFAEGVSRIRSDFKARGIDTTKLLPGDPNSAAFKEATRKLIENLARDVTEDSVADQLNKNPEYGDLKKLSNWKKYTIPQAFLVYFGADFSASLGVGIGGAATIFIVTQPWLKIGIDTRTGKQVSKAIQVQKAILGVPNLLLGAGAGGGAKVDTGAGVVFGPLNHPNDMAGLGLGINAVGTLGPIGIAGKIMTVLRNPPLVYVVGGYTGGVAGTIQIQGNGQILLPLEKFMETFFKKPI